MAKTLQHDQTTLIARLSATGTAGIKPVRHTSGTGHTKAALRRAACRNPLLQRQGAHQPAESSQNDKAPDLRVFVGSVEIGAAWKRTSQENTVYHSVKLDDPSFPAPIFANLVELDGEHVLIWSR